MTVIFVTVIVMEYTLDELVAAVASRLAAAGLDRQVNGQVSAFPDRRTLRYYTTIGLMDRPGSVRDRQAIYGDRHVAQAVAVKRLQASGLALAAIQARLTGLPSAAVEAVARGESDTRLAEVGHRFWAQPPTQVPSPPAPNAVLPTTAPPAPATAAPVPAPPAPAGSAPATPAPATALPAPPSAGSRSGMCATPRWAPPPSVDAGAKPMLAITLDGNTTLLVATDRPLTGPDIAGIRAAAAGLLDHLDRLGHVHLDHLAAAPASLGPTSAATDRKEHP
jgi:hypothetical protein